MGDVTRIYTQKSSEDPDSVLEMSMGNYQSVLILGYDDDGNLAMSSSTNLNRMEILWMIEYCKIAIMSLDDD